MRRPWAAALAGPAGTPGTSTCEFTEAPDGLFDELLDDSVEVAPEVDHLRRDHEVLAGGHDPGRGAARASPTPGPTTPSSLQSLAGIAKLVDQHRRRGADLLYQVYSVDVCRRRLTGPLARFGGPTNPGPAAGHRPNCRRARLPVLLVRRHVRLHAHERHPGRRRGARRAGRVPLDRAGLSPDHGIRVGKWLGDGCMFVGTEVRPVVETVLDLTERMENASIVLPLRIGIAAGKVIVFEGDDFIGMAINLASRLCDAAGPGEILANDEVVAALGDDFPVVPLGERPIPGHRHADPRCGGSRPRPSSRTTSR